jgi:hypothetical protein
MKKKYLQRNKLFLAKGNKRYLALLTIALITSALVISYSLLLVASIVKAAGPETQFKIDLAYAYVGEWTTNTSYIDSDGHQMSLVSQYPSAVMLNITRLPGIKIPECDALIEVYEVNIVTNTEKFEQFVYAVGTNYTSYFSPSKIQSLVSSIDSLVGKTVYKGGYEGTISLNWTDNTSILTNTFGSACYYSSHNSSLGLWKAGTPNAISISVNRIGYLTMSNDLVTVFKDTTTNTKASAQLSSYEEGFLHNSIISADKLPQTNLFAPVNTNTSAP